MRPVVRVDTGTRGASRWCASDCPTNASRGGGTDFPFREFSLKRILIWGAAFDCNKMAQPYLTVYKVTVKLKPVKKINRPSVIASLMLIACL